LDPLKLLEEIRALQAHLAALGDGESLPVPSANGPDLQAFLASLSSTWRAGEIRPTFSIEARPRYLRGLQTLATPMSAPRSEPQHTPIHANTPAVALTRPSPIYAATGQAKLHAVRMVWPIVSRRLEDLPNLSATHLFEELSIQFPGRPTAGQYKSFLRRVNRWRRDARARGVVIGPKTYRRPIGQAAWAPTRPLRGALGRDGGLPCRSTRSTRPDRAGTAQRV